MNCLDFIEKHKSFVERCTALNAERIRELESGLSRGPLEPVDLLGWEPRTFTPLYVSAGVSDVLDFEDDEDIEIDLAGSEEDEQVTEEAPRPAKRVKLEDPDEQAEVQAPSPQAPRRTGPIVVTKDEPLDMLRTMLKEMCCRGRTSFGPSFCANNMVRVSIRTVRTLKIRGVTVKADKYITTTWETVQDDFLKAIEVTDLQIIERTRKVPKATWEDLEGRLNLHLGWTESQAVREAWESFKGKSEPAAAAVPERSRDSFSDFDEDEDDRGADGATTSGRGNTQNADSEDDKPIARRRVVPSPPKPAAPKTAPSPAAPKPPLPVSNLNRDLSLPRVVTGSGGTGAAAAQGRKALPVPPAIGGDIVSLLADPAARKVVIKFLKDTTKYIRWIPPAEYAQGIEDAETLRPKIDLVWGQVAKLNEGPLEDLAMAYSNTLRTVKEAGQPSEEAQYIELHRQLTGELAEFIDLNPEVLG